MAFQLSPGVNVSEIDLSTVVPAVATSIGGFAGPFTWGPAEEVVTVSSENVLRDRFGLPNDDNFEYWFSAANFLAYSNNLKVVRALPDDALNASGNNGLLIKNSSSYTNTYENELVEGLTDCFAAKYPGSLGNGLRISICPNANAYSQNLTSGFDISTNTDATISVNTVDTTDDSTNYIVVGDLIALSNGSCTTTFVEVTNVTSSAITVASNWSVNVGTGASITRKWKHASAFSSAPGTSPQAKKAGALKDEMHIVVIDTVGRDEFGGVKNLILEKYEFVSKASDAKLPDGSSNYFKNALNNRSKYIWWINNPPMANNWGETLKVGTTTQGRTFVENENLDSQNFYLTLANGSDGDVNNAPNLEEAYDVMGNAELVNISLLVSGPAGATLSNYLVSNIAEVRKDVMVFLSPPRDAVVDNYGQELNDILSYRESLRDENNLLLSSSYAVMDSGWKYQYDKYADTYRWVPLNGDVAGLSARADLERDPWFSPAGVNRGILKNVVKLAWNPTKAERDELYQKQVNPVVSFPGEGAMLYGDKTMLDRPSAFDRINVRRLFIVIEKAIAKAARSTMFEFNDQFTRSQFVSLIEPYLRDVQGRRGISDFRVVCDESNNTPEVIDRNEFVGDIYVKPARSINFIQLNFVAVRTGVAFNEIVGQF